MKKTTVLVGNTLYDAKTIPTSAEKDSIITEKVAQNKATIQREKDKKELRRACDTVKFNFVEANGMEKSAEVLRVSGKPDFYNRAWKETRDRAIQYINSAIDTDMLKVLVEQFNQNKRVVSMYSKEDLETMADSLKARKKGLRFKPDATDKVFKVRISEAKGLEQIKRVIYGWFMERGLDIRNSTIVEDILYKVCGMVTNTTKKERANSGYGNLLKNNSTKALNNLYCALIESMIEAKAIKTAVLDKDILEVINNKDSVMIYNNMGRVVSGSYGTGIEMSEQNSKN